MKAILRRCVSCRQTFPRIEMRRLLYQRKTKQFYWLTGSQTCRHLFGRSAYVCDQPECLAVAFKGKKLQKSLKTAIPDAILETLSTL